MKLTLIYLLIVTFCAGLFSTPVKPNARVDQPCASVKQEQKPVLIQKARVGGVITNQHQLFMN